MKRADYEAMAVRLEKSGWSFACVALRLAFEREIDRHVRKARKEEREKAREEHKELMAWREDCGVRP